MSREEIRYLLLDLKTRSDLASGPSGQTPRILFSQVGECEGSNRYTHARARAAWFFPISRTSTPGRLQKPSWARSRPPKQWQPPPSHPTLIPATSQARRGGIPTSSRTRAPTHTPAKVHRGPPDLRAKHLRGSSLAETQVAPCTPRPAEQVLGSREKATDFDSDT